MKLLTFFLLLFSIAWAAPKTPHSLALEPYFSEEIFQEAQNLYDPLVDSLGKKLIFEIQDISYSSGSAHFEGNIYKVVITQGLLDNPRLTADGLRAIVCHELGHLFGGSPRRHIPMDWDGPTAEDGLTYISSEGQADYYTTRSCFWRMVQGQDHRLKLSNRNVPAIVQQKCAEVWGEESDNSLICQRAALGGKDFLNLSFEFPISFDTPDAHEAPQLIQETYPDRQCRLDTLLAGALCKDKAPLKMDFTETRNNECTTSIGKRPRCWYVDKAPAY